MADPLVSVSKAADRLAARQAATDEARERLYAAILAAYQAGESKAAIARAAGVTRQWVMTILERRG